MHNYSPNYQLRNKGSSKENPRKMAWMLTFSDLLSLILTFFVLLYSMSSLQDSKWTEIVKSLSQRLNPDNTVETHNPSEQLSIDTVDLKYAEDLNYLYTIISEKFATTEIAKDILEARLQEDQLILSLPADVAFVKGSAELNPDALDIINFLGDVVGTIANHIDVIGHSDPTPLKGSKYPSNWELSLSRALNVSSVLKSRGYLYHINIFGRSSSTLETLDPSVSKKERYQFMRRVDIVIRTNVAEL